MLIQKLTPEIISAAIDGFEAQKRHIDEKILELGAMLPGASGKPAAAVTTEAVPQRKHRKFSAAARRRMREAQQHRWAKVRGESQPSTPSPVKAAKPKRQLTAAAKAKLVANLRKARADKAAKAKTAEKKGAPARKKGAVKKAAVKNAPAKAAKRAPVKKVATGKKKAPAPAPTVTPGAPE
jgi:hypothetical protein